MDNLLTPLKPVEFEVYGNKLAFRNFTFDVDAELLEKDLDFGNIISKGDRKLLYNLFWELFTDESKKVFNDDKKTFFKSILMPDIVILSEALAKLWERSHPSVDKKKDQKKKMTQNP